MGRAYKTSYAGPERFTAFRGTFCKIEQSAAPELYAMAQAFPKEFSRALRFAGNLLRAELKAALRGTGGVRASWRCCNLNNNGNASLAAANSNNTTGNRNWNGSAGVADLSITPYIIYCTV